MKLEVGDLVRIDSGWPCRGAIGLVINTLNGKAFKLWLNDGTKEWFSTYMDIELEVLNKANPKTME